MDTEANTHHDNQLLIDFIKDTYTIESNKHIFIWVPYLIKGISGYKGVFKQSLFNNKINLKSVSETESDEEYVNSEDILNVIKYKVFNSIPAQLYYFELTNQKGIDNFFSSLIENYKKSFNNDIESQKNKYKDLYSILKVIKETDYSFYIPLLSLYYYENKFLTNYNDGRKFINLFVKNYNSLDVFKARKYENTYNDNHFFMWFYIRYYVNRTLPANSVNKNKNNIFKYYPRIKESALLGICDKNKVQEDKDKALFNVCIDIFQILNFTFSDLFVVSNADLSIYKKTEDVTCYQIMKDTYGEQVDSLSRDVKFSDRIKSKLLTISDVCGTNQNDKANDILDCNDIDTILKPFKDYIVSKIKTTLDEEWQKYLEDLDITNIFATINPNFYSFKRGVNKYQNLYSKERTVLIFVKLNNIIQIRFDDILETRCKLILVLYDEPSDADSTNSGNNNTNQSNQHIIECSGMNSENIRILFYDTTSSSIISLNGKSELSVDETTGMPTGVFSNNQKVQLEYNSFQNVLLLSYNRFIFKLINYQAVLNILGIAGITLEGSIKTADDATYKSSSDESIVTLNLTSSDKAIIEEYVKELPIYMFIKLTEEIIDGKLENISKKSEKLTLTYIFKCRFVSKLTNKDVRFSFVKESFFYTKKGSSNDKPVGAGSFNCEKDKYTICSNFTFSNLPDRVYIRDVVPLYYKDNTLKAQVNLEIINQTKSLEEIEECIIWKYILIDKKTMQHEIPVQEAVSLKEIYNNDIDKVTGKVLDIWFTEDITMYLHGEHGISQMAVAFIPSIEGLGKYQDFINNKHAIILGYNGSNFLGVTNS